MEQTLRMLVSIQEGMFLEPLSQIVAKELVGTVEMGFSEEKIRRIGNNDVVMSGNCFSERGPSSECFRIRQTVSDAE